MYEHSERKIESDNYNLGGFRVFVFLLIYYSAIDLSQMPGRTIRHL